MWNMMMGTNLVVKSLGCIQNSGLQQLFVNQNISRGRVIST